jgi:HD-GYP domain-containing protein (c-di-GMP phosphodiesterase class II)
MTTDRSYRPAMTHEEALAELLAHAGTQFDPRVVDALVRVLQRGRPKALHPAAMLASG